MTITLYHYGNSVCAEKVRLCLFEKEVEWESRHLDLFKGDQFDPEYLKLNPKAVVPTLVDDGKVQVESTIICEYVDDIGSGPPLRPPDPYQRAQMRLFPKLVDEGLHPGVGIFSFVAMFADRLRKLPAEERAERLASIPDLERRDRQSSIVEMGADAPHVVRSIAHWEYGLTKIEKALADGRDWIMGDQYTLADLAPTPYMARLEYIEYDDMFLADRPLTQAWWDRVKARPSFEAANRAWLSEAEFKEMSEGGLATRDAVAAKRNEFLATDPAAAPAPAEAGK